MLLPALSRDEPEFFIRTSAGKARRKAAIPSAFFLFDEKQIDISISESIFLTQLISPPSSSLSFSGKGYAPYLNVGRHSGILLFWGPSYAMHSIKKSKPLGSCRDYKKRVRRCSSTFFLPPAPA
ncbi:hypothetical protein VPH35_014607 [Triticum aestivum]